MFKVAHNAHKVALKLDLFFIFLVAYTTTNGPPQVNAPWIIPPINKMISSNILVPLDVLHSKLSLSESTANSSS